jgi:hypothetical protein
VLIDYDRAKKTFNHCVSSYDIVGSIPYMAIDLLRSNGSITHAYRHDVESFGWTFLLAVTDSEDKGGKVQNDYPLWEWFRYSRDHCAVAKESILFRLNNAVDQAEQVKLLCLPADVDIGTGAALCIIMLEVITALKRYKDPKQAGDKEDVVDQQLYDVVVAALQGWMYYQVSRARQSIVHAALHGYGVGSRLRKGAWRHQNGPLTHPPPPGVAENRAQEVSLLDDRSELYEMTHSSYKLPTIVGQ